MRPGTVRLSFLVVFLLLTAVGCKHQQKSPEKKTAPVQKQKLPVAASGENPSEFRKKLNISEKEIRQNKLYAFAEDWYGTPYQYGGCTKKGVDCSCFINVLYQQVYDKTLARSANDMFKMCDQISLDDAKQGDLVFFKIGSNIVTHVGVFISGSLFIHSSTSRGVIVNSLDEAYYKKYYFCAGKIRHA